MDTKIFAQIKDTIIVLDNSSGFKPLGPFYFLKWGPLKTERKYSMKIELS